MSFLKKSVIREWAESIIIAFLLAMIIRTFLVQAFKIPTGSMRPTLMEGDIILVNKFVYGAKIPFTALACPNSSCKGRRYCFYLPGKPQEGFYQKAGGFSRREGAD
jgi:signal peptidase I